jgi:hypothetical protein
MKPSCGLQALIALCAVGVVALIVTRAAAALNVLPGWPQGTGAGAPTSVAIADLDGDGDLEVVAACHNGSVTAWHSDGSPVSGWPQTTGGRIYSSVAVGDLEGDGGLEVVVGCQDGKVYAWHGDGTHVAGWPRATGGYVDGSPALADLDGDGELEVIVGSSDGKVYVWRADGIPVPGWPQTIAAPVEGFISNTGTPAVGDLDSDGDLEIVALSYDRKLYALHADGSLVAGWPQAAGWAGAYSPPSLADLDGDGDLEVVLASDTGYLYVWHGDGTPVGAGWPDAFGTGTASSPAVGDITELWDIRDGAPEIVAGVRNRVYAWYANSAAVAGWPEAVPDHVGNSVALADLDGDGPLEVLIGSGWDLYAWHGDGTIVPGWPQLTGGVVDGSPAIADLDGDGDVEVVAGSQDGKVYAWSCDTPTRDLLAWPMFRHDAQRSGCYGGPQQPPVTNGGLSGTVTMRGTADSIAGATVEAYLAGELKGSGVTDAGGIYVIYGLPAGEYVVVARGANYFEQTKAGTVVAGQFTYVNFSLEPFATIKGQVRVRVTGANLAGATVTVYLDGQPVAITITDSNGIYVIQNLPPSAQYVVSAAKTGYETQTKGPVSVSLGETTYLNFNLIIPSLKGQVRDAADGTPLIGAAVKAYWATGALAHTMLTMPRYGLYEFGAELVPEIYRVSASMPGYVTQTRWNVEVMAGATTYVNFNLQRSGILTGQVTDTVTGAPIIGAAIQARTGGVVWAIGTTAAPYGIYRITSDLPAGTYSLLCRAPGYYNQGKPGIAVTAGATTYVNFNLAPR